MSAAAASRDITLFHAMDLLHASGYDFARGALALVDHGAPRSANQIYMYPTLTNSI
jgi:metastasis-associated protein MTA